MVWIAQSYFPRGSLMHAAFEDFADRVRVASGERLRIEVFGAGEVVDPFDMLYGLLDGRIQAGLMASVYWSDREPGFAALGLPAAWTSPLDADAWVHVGGGLDLIREMYGAFGVHTIGTVVAGTESLVSVRRVAGAADFAGLRVRVPSQLNADFFERLGAETTILPGSRVKYALETGDIDVADWGTVFQNFESGLHGPARYFIWPGFHSTPISDFSVAADTWTALPEDLKEIVESAVRVWSLDVLQRHRVRDLQAVRRLEASGVRPVAIDETNLARFRRAAVETWRVWQDRSPMARRLIDSQIARLRATGALDPPDRADPPSVDVRRSTGDR